MKRTGILSIALLSTLFSFSQSSSPLENTLLWKISGKGLAHPSYLFGTMHVLCNDDAKLSDSLKNVIAQADQIYFEIDLGDMSGMLNSMKYMRMNDSKKLSDLLNKDDYQKVKTYFDKHSSLLPFSMLERFKPLLISSLIEEEGLECQATNGMEMVIMSEAKSHQKKINGLETAEFQAGLFDSIPYEKQAHDLVNYIDSATEYKKMTSDLANVYKEQNLQKIDELTKAGDPGINNYLDLLLYGRNRKWVSALGNLMNDHSLLIAVGAGHLPGDQGVINLLKQKGYTLTPIKNQITQ